LSLGLQEKEKKKKKKKKRRKYSVRKPVKGIIKMKRNGTHAPIIAYFYDTRVRLRVRV
jgi:hypothetical protein